MFRARVILPFACLMVAGACRGQSLEIDPEPAEAPPDASPLVFKRPESARRVVRTFDFEASDPSAPELPEAWYRAQHDPPGRERPGFPLDNLALLDFGAPAANGAGSIRLPTGGGSASLRLDEGAVPALSGADYLIEAQVRTEGLVHARAFLAARLLDEEGKPIEGAEARSAPVRSARWTPVSVMLAGDHPSAAFIQIDLELRQPQHFEPATLGAHQVWQQDFSGHASFDEVIISQFPRIEIRTTAPANIVLASETPTLDVLVRDLTGERIRTRIVVQDVSGQIVDQREQPMPPGRGRTQWSPSLRALGWYRATLEILAGERIVGSSYVDFVWAPDPSLHTASSGRAGRLADGSFGATAASADRVRFGLIATELPAPMRAEFAQLVRRSGVGAVSVPVWGASTDVDPDRLTPDLGPVIEALSLEWQDITLALGELPPDIAARAQLGAHEPPAASGRDGATLRSRLLPFLERYGQAIARWQVGQPADPISLDDDLAANVAAARKAIGEVTPSPSVVALWRADHELAPLGAAAGDLGGVLVSMPAHWRDQAVHELAADWTALGADPTCELTLAISSESAEDFGRLHNVGVVVRRMLALWQATGGEARAALVDPWRWEGGRRGQVMPAPELAAWRGLVDRLTDRRIVGEYPLGKGMRCLILAPLETAAETRGGALALWLEPGAEAEGPLALYLGDGEPQMVDVFGNVTPLERPAGQGAAAYSLRIGPTPVFIEHVDTELLRFLASLRVEPGFLETSALEHRLEVIATNPWPVGVSGRLFVRSPGGQLADGTRDRSWRLTPRTADFDIAPGGELRAPMVAAFGPGESSGRKALELEIDLDARTSYRRLRVAAPFEVGLRDFALDMSWRHGSEAGDVVVEAQITNTSQRSMSLDVACFAPGFARQSATVASLPPAAAVTRHFVFRGGLEKLRGREVVVTLSDSRGGGRLNGAVGF
jgi:hypothetical protein